MSNFKEYGRIASEINVSYVGSNNTACGKFSLAVDRVFGKDKDGKKITDFHNVQCWGKSAELLEKLGRKGDRIVVEGTVQNNNYEDKNGVKHYGYIINAEQLKFVENKKDRQSEDGQTDNFSQQSAPKQDAPSEPDDEDFVQVNAKAGDLPFFSAD